MIPRISDGNQVFLENVGDGSLTLTKEVTGSGGEQSREFHFTITVEPYQMEADFRMAYTERYPSVTERQRSR